MVWPFVNFLGFRYIEPLYRVLFANSVSVFWNCYLSILNYRNSIKNNNHPHENNNKNKAVISQ